MQSGNAVFVRLFFHLCNN